MWRNSENQFGTFAKILHWLIALAVIGMSVVGLFMVEMKISPDKIKIYALHKSIGLTILSLMFVRLIWRCYSAPPHSLPMPRWQKNAARFTHFGLYFLLFLMPFSGWMFNSAANFPLRWFNLFAVPDLVSPNKSLQALAGEIHEIGFWLLAALVLLHVVASLKHHFVDRDDTLRRMWPRSKLTHGDALVTTDPSEPEILIPNQNEEQLK